MCFPKAPKPAQAPAAPPPPPMSAPDAPLFNESPTARTAIPADFTGRKMLRTDLGLVDESSGLGIPMN